MIIREAKEEDYPKFIEIRKNDGFEHAHELTHGWIHMMQQRGDKFFAAEDSEVKGFAIVKLDEKAKLHMIAVQEEFQGQGIGKLLVEKCEQEARDKGKKEMWLYVHETNQALGFYKKLGYNVKKAEPNFYGKGKNALMMSRIL